MTRDVDYLIVTDEHALAESSQNTAGWMSLRILLLLSKRAPPRTAPTVRVPQCALSTHAVVPYVACHHMLAYTAGVKQSGAAEVANHQRPDSR